MRRLELYLAGLALLAATATQAAPPDPALAAAEKIDRHLAAGWEKGKVKPAAPGKRGRANPAAPADDAEFLRRVYLQLAGRIPSVAEAHAFLRDRTPDKRRQVVVRLLDSPRYVAHFANVWRSWMMPEADASIQARFLIPGFENWLREKLRDNVPYDKMVHELLTAAVGGNQLAYFPGGGGAGGSPSAYYVGKELK